MEEGNREGSFLSRNVRLTPGCINAIVLCVILGILLYIFLPSQLNRRRSIWEVEAKARVRGYGEVQAAYSLGNATGMYARWETLEREGWLNAGFTKDNLIDKYFFYTFVYNPPIVIDPDTEEPVSPRNRFVGVAFPRDITPPGYLSTFAIRDDQVLRVYRPKTPDTEIWNEEMGWEVVGTWEPIA